MRTTSLLLLLSTVAVSTCGALALAQDKAAPPAITQGAPGIKRTVLQKFDVPGTTLETIVALVEVAPKFIAGRHVHPGSATGYVLEGEFFMALDGEAEKILKAGDSLTVPPGKIHNEGTKDGPAKIIAIYVVEKGKPLVSPVQ